MANSTIPPTSTGLTRHQQSLDVLVAREAQYHPLFTESMDAVYICTLDGNFVSVNPALLQLFGYQRNEVLAFDVSALYADDENRHRFQTEIAKTGTVRNSPVRLRKKDGTVIDGLLTSTVLHNANGEIIGYLGIIRDMTQQRRLERQILEVSEYEQRQIGGDLHDGLGQDLNGIVMFAHGLAEKLQERGLNEEAKVAAQILQYAKDAADLAHGIAVGLIPMQLEQEGLVAVLGDLASKVQLQSGISCRLEVVGDENVLLWVNTPTLAIHLYRIAQEAVTNAKRHSQAEEIVIELRATDETLTLTIRDDGMGIDMPISTHSRMGIYLMQYRANIIGGELEIQCGDDGGTVVKCSIAHRGDSTEGL